MQVRRKERWDLHQSRAIEAALAAASNPDASSPSWSKVDLGSLEKESADLLKQAQALIASQEEHHGRKERDERAKLLQDMEEHYKDMGMPLLSMSINFSRVRMCYRCTQPCAAVDRVSSRTSMCLSGCHGSPQDMHHEDEAWLDTLIGLRFHNSFLYEASPAMSKL